MNEEMKQYLIAVTITFVLVSGLLLGCNSEPASTPTPTPAELQTQVETLQEELNQLREQKGAEILQQAEAYYGIVELCSTQSKERLMISSDFWNLIKATGDPQLISLCQPQEFCFCFQVNDYCWSMYMERVAEYNELQPTGGQLIMPKPFPEKTEGK